MQTHASPIWHDDGYWAARKAAYPRAAALRRQAIDAFWARIAHALRRRLSQRSAPPRRVALCD